MSFLKKQLTKPYNMNIYPRFVIDRQGNVIPLEQLAKREGKGWLGAFGTFFRELESTVGEFMHECEDFLPSPSSSNARDGWELIFKDMEKQKRRRKRR